MRASEGGRDVKTPMDRDVSDAGVSEEGGRRGITRRDVLIKGAIVSGAVWVAPVVESFTSPAAAQSVPLGCQFAFVFYYHSEANSTSKTYLIYFYNSAGTTQCSFAGGSTGTCNPASYYPSPDTYWPCTNVPAPATANDFTLAQGGVIGASFPAATASLTYPTNTGGFVTVGGFPGGGNCSGQFVISGNIITAGKPSNKILAAFSGNAAGTGCGWTCPSSYGTNNQVDLTSACTPPQAA